MAASHGSKAALKIQNAAGVLVDITDYITSGGLNRTVDTNETTTWGKDSKQYIPGLKDGTFPIEGNYDPAADALFDGIQGMVRTFEYYPTGTASGSPMYSGSCIMTSYDAETPVDDKGAISGEFQLTGTVTRALVA